MKIRTGDTVYMRAGKDRGKTGKVISTDRRSNRLVVEGLNLLVKHVRAKREREKGQRIQFPASVPSSKVMLVCPKCGKNTRVGFQILEDGKKFRRCMECKETFT